MAATFRRHWPEYLCEALGLGVFMMSATAFAVLLFHPASPLGPGQPLLRRALMGLAMGGTAVAIIYSPPGRRSGAHLNPAVTLTFLRLGKIAPADAAFYVAAQVVGGVLGMLIAVSALQPFVVHPAVRYVVTVPGAFGVLAAFAAEVVMAAVLMTVVLRTSNAARSAPFTGLLAGALVATYVTLEAPVSGMSLNPARTLAAAVPAGIWTGWWIYFTAPLVGMMTAAELHRVLRRPVLCAKLHHDHAARCIFRCDYAARQRSMREFLRAGAPSPRNEGGMGGSFVVGPPISKERP
jgi:aquaporin Z